MDLAEIGEFGLIDRLLRLSPDRPDEIIVGPGDDAAVWRVGDDHPSYVIATTDTLVEGVHFLPGRTPWADLGYKAIAVNASDVYAMGGEPQFALVTLGLPPEMDVAQLDAVYRGLHEFGCGVTVVGGDVVRSPVFFITVALTGKPQVRDGRPLLLRRSRARPGDAIAVTGTLGDSAAGLRRFSAGAGPDDPLVRAHLRPAPPAAAAISAAQIGVQCGIDVSDGLLQDIGHLCEMSGTGAVVHADAIPISDAVRAAFPAEALRLACTGGEDYQLVLAGPAALLGEVAAVPSVRLTVIGEMTDGPEKRVHLLDADGREITFESPGWDHLRPAHPGTGA